MSTDRGEASIPAMWTEMIGDSWSSDSDVRKIAAALLGLINRQVLQGLDFDAACREYVRTTSALGRHAWTAAGRAVWALGLWNSGDEDSALRQLVLAELDLRHEADDPQSDPPGGPTGLNAASNNLGAAYIYMRAYEFGLPHLRRAVADSTARYSHDLWVQHLVDATNLSESCVRWALHLESIGRTEEARQAAEEARSSAIRLGELAQVYEHPQALALSQGLLIAAKGLLTPHEVDVSDVDALQSVCHGEVFGEEESKPILWTALVRTQRLAGDAVGCAAAAQETLGSLRSGDHELAAITAREHALLHGTDSPAWQYAQLIATQAESVRQRSVAAFRTRLELFGLEQRLEEASAHKKVLLQKLEESARTAADLLHAATHDPLTGLPNRALFRQRLDAALLQVWEAQANLAVVFVDLDDLKLINDRFGHAVGDQVLQAVARSLVDHVPASDTVARLSGDEFVILTSYHDASQAQSWADALVAQVGHLNSAHETSVSVGVCLVAAGCGSSAEAVLSAADEQMYRAKKLGKSRACVTVLTWA